MTITVSQLTPIQTELQSALTSLNAIIAANSANVALVSTPSSASQVGVAYSQSNVANGGVSPYAYSVSAGALPAGVTLNASTGLVSGTPSAVGAFSYTIEATDSTTPTPETATQTISGVVSSAPGATLSQAGIVPNMSPIPSNSTLRTPSGTITDSSGNVWSFVGTFSSNGWYGYPVHLNGTLISQSPSSGIVMTLDVNGVLWDQLSSGEWYKWTGSAWTDEGTTGPTT